MPRIKKDGIIHDTLTGYDFRVDKPLTPLATIRAKCRECTNDQRNEVETCAISDCPNWPWRNAKATQETRARQGIKKRTGTPGVQVGALKRKQAVEASS